MNDEIKKIRQMIIDTVLSNEKDILEVTKEVNEIIASADEIFKKKINLIDNKYNENQNFTKEEYLSEYKKVKEIILRETEEKLSAFLSKIEKKYQN